MDESLHYLTQDETRLSEPNSDGCMNFDMDNKVLGDIKDLEATDTKETEDIKEIDKPMTVESPSLSAAESVINTSLVVSPCLGSNFVMCDEVEYELRNCTLGWTNPFYNSDLGHAVQRFGKGISESDSKDNYDTIVLNQQVLNN